MNVFPVISTAFHPKGPLVLAKDLSSALGAELIDQHLFFGFAIEGLNESQIHSLVTMTRLSVLPHPNMTLLTGSLYNWSIVFQKLLHKDSDLQELLCKIFFFLDQTEAKDFLSKYNKVPLTNGSFFIQ